MSRFDTRIVNETWEIERDEKTGRKRAIGQDNGRTVKVWVSDIKNENGLYPIVGRYLLPLPGITLIDGVLKKTTTLWVTRHQYKAIMRACDAPVKNAGIEDLLHAVAKLFDKIGDKIKERIGPDEVLGNLLDLAFDQAMDKIMDKDFIIEKIGEIKF